MALRILDEAKKDLLGTNTLAYFESVTKKKKVYNVDLQVGFVRLSHAVVLPNLMEIQVCNFKQIMPPPPPGSTVVNVFTQDSKIEGSYPANGNWSEKVEKEVLTNLFICC